MRAARPDTRHRALAAGITLLLGMACARIEAPPGGPPDRKSPAVVSHSPASGSVNVGATPQFSLEFDEWVNRASITGEVYLSPTHEGGLDVRWFGRTLKVTPRQPLPPDRTFLLEIGTGVRDIAGNRLAQPFRLAFSTGADLDTFRFSGWLGGVDVEGRSVIWAWPLDEFPLRPLEPAPWQTRPDSAGVFRFSSLPERPFRLFAISDRNTNGRWDSATEPASLASADPVPGGGYADVLPTMYLGVLPLDSLGLEAAEGADRNHVILQGRLDLPGNPGRAAQIELLEISDSLGRRVPIMTLREEEDGRYLLVTGTMDSLRYTLRFRDGSDSVSFTGRTYSQNPFQGFQRPTLLDTKRRLRWYPPRGVIAETRGKAWLGQKSDTAMVQPQILDALELVWGLPRVREGDTLFVAPGLLEGLSGDKWPTELAMYPLQLPARLATGALEVLFTPEPPVPSVWRVRVRPAGDEPADRVPVDLPLVSPLKLPDLPEGWIGLDVYHDRDGDKAWTPGQLQPFRHAEARLPLADSLEVYPGWTREGLQLTLPAEVLR